MSSTSGKSWTSPDGSITKNILVEGVWGSKPSEWSECQIEISDCDILKQFNGRVVIGDNDGDYGRLLDVCLLNMNKNEISHVILKDISCTIHVLDVVHNGFIYQWSAVKKYEISLYHKEKGVSLYKNNKFKDAAYRFNKALKIISSIPIDIENTADNIDNLSVAELNKLKALLYNNIATLHMQKKQWNKVMEICQKVFIYDSKSVKAHYKIGLAYLQDRNFEKAKESFEQVLEVEPGNKAAIENLNVANAEIKKATINFNNIVKKMFT